MDFKVGDKVILFKKCEEDCSICEEVYGATLTITHVNKFDVITNLGGFSKCLLKLVSDSRDYSNGF